MKKVYPANGKWLDFSEFYIMGILNVTPDSFSDGGKYTNLNEQIKHFEKLIQYGAKIVDIGGQSTRPNAQRFSPTEEWTRLEPILQWIHRNCPQDILISVDTFYAEVAHKSLDHGVNIVNDVMGEEYEIMLQLCKSYNATYILMHAQGTPQTMQNNPTYDNVVQDIYDFFLNKLSTAFAFEFYNLILDPGFGFGKTLQHNYQLLENITVFQHLGFPILAGISRKSMLTKFFHCSWQELIPIQESLHSKLIERGVNILRVHEPIWVKRNWELFKYCKGL